MSFSPDQIEKKVIQLVNLPTLPGILKRITRMTEDLESSADDVAEIIASDQVLTAKVLRLVNSPVYGFPGRISSITHAVVLLGFNVIKGMILATAVFDTIGKHGRGLWEHSLGCAIISRKIAKEMNAPEAEEVMIAGLLHDLGKVVLSFLYPKEYERVAEEARVKRCHVARAEREVFGVDHARVNRWVAAQWHFPERLADPLAYHHVVDRAKGSAEVTAVVHVADILARAMGYGFPGDLSMPQLNHEAFHSLGISFEQIDRILEEAESEYVAGVDVFALEG